MYDSLLEGKESLQEMAISQTAGIESDIKKVMLDYVFWERVSSSMKILKPIAAAIGFTVMVPSYRMSSVFLQNSKKKSRGSCPLPYYWKEGNDCGQVIGKAAGVLHEAGACSSIHAGPKIWQGHTFWGRDQHGHYSHVWPPGSWWRQSSRQFGQVSKKQGLWEGNGICHANICSHLVQYWCFKRSGTEKLGLRVYSDADWASDVTDRRSTSGYCARLSEGSSLIAWKTRKQVTVALSTCEAEYISLASAIQEGKYLEQLLRGIDKYQYAQTKL